MTSSHQMASRLREIILNGFWVANTNYKKELSGMPLAIATTKIDSLNVISVLVQHIHYYISGILNVFKGGTLDIKDKYSFEFPEISTQQEWEAVLGKFFADTEELAELIELIPEHKLDEIFVDKKYGTYRRNIDGMIEHSYYHLGQIVLLKKLLLKDEA